MILDLREFEEFPAQTTLTTKVGEIAPIRDDVASVGAVTLALTIQQSGEEFYIQGSVAATVGVECARCLVSYDLPLEGQVDFIVTTAEVREQQKAEAVDSEDYIVVDGNVLVADLTDIIRQALVLELPMKPICRDDCQGLCPQCGANRNESPCDCRVEEPDPRWEGLKKLKTGSEKRK